MVVLGRERMDTMLRRPDALDEIRGTPKRRP